MLISDKTVWLIMTPDRKIVAKGVTRNRHLVCVDEPDNKRFLTYRSKKSAEAGFRDNGFYRSSEATRHIREHYPEAVESMGNWERVIFSKLPLIAVPCRMVMEVEDEN